MISHETVAWGYRLILGREPESNDVIRQKMQCEDMSDLSGQLIYSHEFVSKQPSFMPPINQWVLMEHERGFRIWVNLADTAISWPILRNEFERDELAFLVAHVSEGDAIIDIGTNIGYFALIFSGLVGPSGKVLGFEPMPFLHERAAMSVKESGFGQCEIFNVALAKEAGAALLVYAPGSPNWGGAYLSFDGSVPTDHASVSVPVKPLSDYTDGITPKLIKIDVEGGEYLVLSSALDLISLTKPIIVSEIHSDQLRRVSGVSTSQYIGLLKSVGYRCHEIGKGGLLGPELLGDEAFTVTNVAFMPHA